VKGEEMSNTTTTRRVVLVFILLVLTLVFAASPVIASPADRPVGDQIDVYNGGPTEFAADTADPGNTAEGGHPLGLFGFRLSIDAVDQGPGLVLNDWISYDGERVLRRLWRYNYEDGLPAGTYEFTGYWYAPCAVAVQYEYTGPCANPRKSVLALTRVVEVTFS
jgi:hypothetical protein